MPNNIFSLRFAPKSVPGLPDVGVPQGDEDGPRTPLRWLKGSGKKFQMTNFTMPYNIFSLKFAPKSVPGLLEVGVPQGDEDGPRTPPRWLEGSGKSFK